MEDHQDHAEAVYRSASRKTCREYALVLHAAEIKSLVQKDHGRYTILVAGSDARRARAELEAYASENCGSRIQEVDASRRTDGWTGVMSYAAVILLVAICNDRGLLGLAWFDAGKTSAQLICQGEWWRTVTALTLHANPGHLIANLVVGGLFGLFAAQLLGSGLAWFSILIGGAAGNAINAWCRSAEHTSVGASTAIFAALGIVSACAWVQRRAGRAFSLKRFAPLIGGVVLLSFLGLGDAPTDVGAHVAGFASGVILGTLCGMLNMPHRLAKRGQTLLAVSALGLLVLGWVLALVNSGG